MSADRITVELVGSPQGKGRPRFVRRGEFVGAYTPDKTRRYESDLRLAAQDAMARRSPLEGPLIVRVDALFAVPASWSRAKQAAALKGDIRPTGKPDWENLAKVLDAFNQIVWRDDAQVVEGHIAKWYSARPRFTVTVEPLFEVADLLRVAAA